MRRRVAVVGAGAAGLSAAYRLREECEVTLFEASDRLGGHACTVEVEDGGRTLGLDTAFVVFNRAHYPRLGSFFDALDVPVEDHPGRFCFFDLDQAWNYTSEDFDLDTESVKAKYSPEFVALHQEAARFHAEAPRHFVRKQADMPLGEYLDANGYSDEFRYGFIVLIAAATWSVPPDLIWEMPASTIIAFFFAHGHEGLGGRAVPWNTVAGGSITYVRAAAEALTTAGGAIRASTPVRGILQKQDGVQITTDAEVEHFDQAVVATHADVALSLLENPTPKQQCLKVFRYSPTSVVLHTDRSCMPVDTGSWRSWNYGRSTKDGRIQAWAVYYLNRLQAFDSEADYFVSIEYPDAIEPRSVIAEFEFRHPIISMPVRRIQHELHGICRDPASPILFAGSYVHSTSLGPDLIGSHEAACDSGFEAAEAILARPLITSTYTKEPS